MTTKERNQAGEQKEWKAKGDKNALNMDEHGWTRLRLKFFKFNFSQIHQKDGTGSDFAPYS